MRKYIFWAAVMAAGIISVLAGYFLNQTAEIRLAHALYAQINPTVADEGGVDVNSAFSLSFEGTVRAAQVRKYLSVEPQFEFEVHQGKNLQEVLVVPAEPLAPGTLYRFTLLAEKERLNFALQTKNPLEIAGVFPQDKALDVDVHTSISITFNTANSVDCAPYFKIEPEVEGRFHFSGRTLTFTPHLPLMPETIYTVTALEGLPLVGSNLALEEDYAFQFETAAQNGAGGAPLRLSLPGQGFAPGEIPFFRVEQAASPWAQVAVYAYDGPQSYGEALLKDLQHFPGWSRQSDHYSLADFSALSPVLEDARPLIEGESCHYLTLAAALPSGYYALEAEIDGLQRQLHFQVSPLKAFAQPMEEDMLLWVVHPHQSLTNGRVQELATGEIAAIDAEGIALAAGNPEQKQEVFVVEAQQGSLVIGGRRGAAPGHPVYYDLQAYLYTDRYHYQNTDTLSFWGLMQLPEEEEGEALELSIGLYGSLEPEELILESPVHLEGQIFSGSFDLRNFNNGSYSLALKEGERLLYRRDFSVQEPKPAQYRLAVLPGQKAALAGEELNFEIQAEDFEGRPVPRLRLNYQLSPGRKGSVTTDKDGRAFLSLPAALSSEKDRAEGGENPMELQNLSVTAIAPNGLELEAAAAVLVFGGSAVVESRSAFHPQGMTWEWSLYAADTEPFNKGESLTAAAGDFKGQPLAEERIGVEIYCLEPQRTAASDDEGAEIFLYEEEALLIAEEELMTDSQGRAKLEIPSDAALRRDCRYLVRLESLEGEKFSREYYVYPWLKQAQAAPRLIANKSYYQEGEAFSLTFSFESGTEAGEYLFLSRNQEGWGYNRSQSPVYQGFFQREDAPSLLVDGVFFDGADFHPATGGAVQGDEGQRGLRLQLSPSKARYQPGEKGQIEVAVTDTRGNPAQATLHLRIAPDAALAETGEIGFNQAFCPWLAEALLPGAFLSHAPGLTGSGSLELPAPTAAPGDIGGQAALFIQGQTGEDGKAVFSFEIPGGEGLYIADCLAFNTDFETGEGESHFMAEQVFSVEISANSQYWAGDEAMIFLSAQGELAEGEIIYTLLLEGGNLRQEEILTAEAGERIRYAPGALEPGIYSLTIQARSEMGGEAKTSHFFEIQEEFLMLARAESAPLAEEMPRPDQASQDALALIASPARSQVLQDLWQAAGNISPRLEHAIAAAAAQRLLLDYAGDELEALLPPVNEDFRSYQNHDGGAATLPDYPSDLALSAKAAALEGFSFANEELAAYFIRQAEKAADVKSHALALAGLTALDKPVLNELKSLLALEGLNPEERLCLIWGLTVAGDEQSARMLFRAFTEENPPLPDVETAYACDLWRMLIASACSAPEQWMEIRMELAAYQSPEGENQRAPAAMEEVLAAREILPRLGNEELSFVYNLGGQEERIVLSGREDFRLLLNPGENGPLFFKNIQGDAQLNWFYRESILGETSQLKGASLKREYAVTSGGDELEAGVMKVIIHYKLEADLPAGWYCLSDSLPGGLIAFDQGHQGSWRPVANPWLFSPGRQIASFMLYKEEKQKLTGSCIYYAKVVSAGTFTAGPAILTRDVNEVIARDKARTLLIK